MSQLEDYDDAPVAESAPEAPAAQPRWGRILAWTTVILGGIYILNPTLGIDLLPDNLPLVGNLDEAAILFLMLGALRYLGVRLPDFMERWLQPAPRLPAVIEHEDD